MTTYFATAPQYKAPVRQDGFHLPQHGPPSPSSSSTGSYDPTTMFMLPDAYRKYPSHESSAIDLSEELASLIAGPNADHGHAQNGMHAHSQQAQQHHHHHHHHIHGQHQQAHDFRGVAASFDDGYRPQTHNIFDISAPSVAHPSLLPHPSQSQLPTPSSSAPAYPSAFSLQTSQRQAHDNMSLISPSNSLHSAAGPLQEFNARFNSTLPALNSSMRFDPHPPAPTESVSNGPSAFALQHDYQHATRQQHTPSPSQGQSTVSRSRSRSRAPSTGPGPTRTQSTTRAKRNSISSTSPPPRPTTSIIIPGSMPPLHRANSLTAARGGPGAPDPSVGSPLSLGSAGGWFIPPTTPQQTQHAEYSLPTPDSISSHFGLPGRDHSLGPSLDGGRDPSPPGPSGLTEVAAKQAAIANEKRRRRRESHNAVERRRRDNINEKIGELATLIPECMLDPNAPSNLMPSEDQIMSVSHTKQESSSGAESCSPTPTGVEPTTPSATSVVGDSAAAKANKGIILRKSVDYIRHLQQLVSAQASRNRVLEQELASYRARDGSAGAAIDTSSDDLAGLVLHNEVDMTAFMTGDFTFEGPFDASGSFGSNGHSALASVREADLEDDRPDTAMTDVSAMLTPPSLAGSGSPQSTNGDDDEQLAELSSSTGFHAQMHHEEERGRRGRDGRVGGALDEVRVKREE